MTAPKISPLAIVRHGLAIGWEGFGFLFPLVLAPSLVLSLASYGLGPEAASLEGDAVDPAALAGLALGVLGGFVVTGIACLAALDMALGKRHSVSEYLGQTLRHIGPLIVLGLLISIATSLGLILLIVPALYIAGRFLPWTAAVVFENAGWRGLGRAQELTEGYRWPLAVAVLIMGLVGIAAAAVFLPVMAYAQGSFALSVLLDAAVSALIYMFGATFGAAGYLRLRELKEGLSTADIAATID